MLAINPRVVKFGAAVWDGVTMVAVDRWGDKVVTDYTDLGPHVAFADIPEQRVSVRVVREILSDDLNSPKPGDSSTLVFYTSPMGTDSSRKKVTISVVVTAVRHMTSGPRGMVRTVEMVAVSSDGAVDPVVISDAGGEV